MKLTLKVYDGLPCQTREFEINGIEAEKYWFVNNYDNGDGEEIEYGCNNRITELFSISEVREKLPQELKSLSDEEIERVQQRLSDELVSGGCGWCV